MGKNITIITGSPRKNGNTNILAGAFAEALAEKNTVEIFNSAELNIGPCKACDACYKNGKPCVFSDDFNTIMQSIEKADIIVFAFPVYWYSFPAQIKMVIDKLYSATVVGKDLSGKQSMLITMGADEDPSGFEGLRFSYQRTVELLGWESTQELLIPSVQDKGDIINSGYIEKVQQIASTIE